MVNAEQQSVLSQLLGGNSGWIGGVGSVTVDGDAWRWDTLTQTDTFFIGDYLTGSALGYANWAVNEPQPLSTSMYTAMGADGSWQALQSNDLSLDGYFCEYQIADVRTLSTAKVELGSCAAP